MLDLTLQKKAIRLLAIIMVLSMFLATVAFAVVVTEKINAKKGGTINIAEGIELEFPPGALDKNTKITVEMGQDNNKTTFNFSPSDLVFNVPVELKATYEALSNAKSFDLYLADPNDPENYIEKIKPVKYKWGVVWYLDHFSIYYYRLR